MIMLVIGALLGFSLGFIAGIMITGFLFVNEQIKEVIIKSMQNLIKSMQKGVGKDVIHEDMEIIEPIPTDIEAMEKIFEENDKKGRDTYVAEAGHEDI